MLGNTEGNWAVLSADPRIGTALLNYRIEAVIGRGGMSVVYRTEDVRLKRPVALKLLAPELGDDASFRERFLRESRLASSIDHPAVVPVYDAGEVEGQLYIAMRYVEGSDLRRVLEAGGRLEPRRALALCAQVADALDAAHDRGLVHGDVKPSNVLVASGRRGEHCYLADFGLTQEVAAPGPTASSRHLLGTPDYVSPERIRGEEGDARADVYALGCLLYECLVGRPPFRRDSDIAVVYAHLEEPPPKPSAHRSELSEGIDGVIAKAMAKSPADRYATCTELVDAAYAGLDLAPGVARAAATRSRRALGIAAVSVGLAIVAVVVAVLLSRGEGAPEAAAGSLIRIDASTNRPLDAIPLGGHVSAVAAGASGVWAASFRDGELWRVEPRTGTVTRIPPVGAPRGLALFAGRAYVVSQGPKLGADNVTVYGAANGNRIDGIELIGYVVRAGRGGVWTAGWLDVARLATRGPLRITSTVRIPTRHPLDTAHDRQQLVDVGFGIGSMWVLGDAADRRLWQIDPRLRRISRTIDLSFAPGRLAIGAGSLWVTDQLGDKVVRLDPASGRAIAVIGVGAGVGGIAFGAGSIWVACALDDTVLRIDPGTNRVVASIHVGESPREVAVGGGSVWAAGDVD
jgi:YVTN family beta-propeller protein